MKCRNYSSNLKRSAPKLFNPPPPPTAKELLLPKTRDIITAIRNRIEQIEPEDFPDDPELIVAAKILKLKGECEIDLRKEFPGHKMRSIFLLCEGCDKHMLKRLSHNMSKACDVCAKKRSLQKTQVKNNEKW